MLVSSRGEDGPEDYLVNLNGDEILLGKYRTSFDGSLCVYIIYIPSFGSVSPVYIFHFSLTHGGRAAIGLFFFPCSNGIGFRTLIK